MLTTILAGGFLRSYAAVVLNASVVSGITFVYWAALYVHLFCAVAWLGGILFITGVARPIFEYDAEGTAVVADRIRTRFLGFSWMLAWSTAVSGVVVLLWSTRFVLFGFADRWNVLAHVKILLFITLFLIGVALRTTYRELVAARAEKKEGEDLTPRDILIWRIRIFEQIEVLLAIVILAVVAVMQVS